MLLRHAARTDPGKTRDHNEDSYGIEVADERGGSLFVVCDGIGGFASGEVASELAVKSIIAHFFRAMDRDPEAALEAAFLHANEEVFREGGGKMGTTGVAAFLHQDAIVVANVGDCRAYMVRDGKPRQISRDHSFVAEQVAAGMLTEQQARESSYRNIITRAIGHRPEIEVDTFREPLLQHDVIVLCSDGLHGQVDPDEIALAVTKVPLDDACRALIKLANDRGGPDNITIVAIQVLELTFADHADNGKPAAVAAPTERLQPKAVTDTGTARLTASAVPATGDRRKGSDRRASDRRGTIEQRAVAAPPLPAPRRGNPLRGLLLWASALLLLGAILFGVYFFAVIRGDNNASIPPVVAPRTTQTPLSQPSPDASASAETPTLVPTVRPTAGP
jgi:PPM family protein phosphatase